MCLVVGVFVKVDLVVLQEIYWIRPALYKIVQGYQLPFIADSDNMHIQAVKATEYMEKGNKELAKTKQRNSSSRLYIILIFSVLTTTLLFLDWFHG